MSIRYRPMQPKDVPQCVELVAAQPIVGPRYGDQIGNLGKAWLRVLDSEAKVALVFEEGDGKRTRMVGVGMSVFVQDSFIRELKTPPLFWFGAELTKRILRGDSPVLTYRELREANSRGGLNALVWEGCARVEDIDRPELYSTLTASFMEEHRGFLWKELIAGQVDAPHRFENLLRTGLMYWNPREARYVGSLEKPAGEMIREPHVLGVTREIEQSRFGFWSGSIFAYHPPQLGFGRAEQRMLRMAVGGGTDDELSEGLGVSVSAVKKTWRKIYDRVASCRPDLVPDSRGEEEWQSRGKQKKQRLLDYIRKHPEELRPVSRKLLLQLTTANLSATDGRRRQTSHAPEL